MVFKNTKNSSSSGFTLLELMVAAAIFAFAMSGVVSLYMSCVMLDETNRGKMMAYTDIQSKMEEIKEQAFDNIASYNNSVFNLSGFSSGQGIGRVNITTAATTNSTISRYKIKVTGCFNVKGRTIGSSVTSCTSSPVELITQISK